MLTPEKTWEWEIGPSTSDWSWNLKELSSYRHLLVSLVKREFLLSYQQTILGPVWVVVSPLITLVTYVLVFKKLIGVSIGHLPPVLFYFSGIVLWNFFIESFDRTSNTFRDHIHLFSKVYFPRIIMPLSLVATNFLRCLIQLALLIVLVIYFMIFKGFHLEWSLMRLTFPLAILMVGVMSLSAGLVLSVITAKYRDISNLISMCIRLLMFVTPVIYPLATVPANLRWIVKLNPLSSIFELFRLGLLGEGTVNWPQMAYSIAFMVTAATLAVVLFNKKGSKLIDYV